MGEPSTKTANSL